MKFKDHFNKNPSQNFNKNSKVLKNLKQFKKPQKLGQRSCKCMIKMKENIIPDEEQRSWDRKWSEEDEKLEFLGVERRREVCLLREIEEIWDKNRENPIYRKIINLDRLRAIEKLSRFKTRLLAIKELIRSYRGSKERFSEQRSLMDRGSQWGDRKFLDWSN